MPSIVNADNGVSSGSAGLKSSADSSGVLALQTNGTTAVTVDASQNVSIPKGVGGTPSFSVYRNAAQSISNSTFTKIQFDTKNFDTATAFDITTNYRFQPTVTGYYQINGVVSMAGSTVSVMGVEIYKTGASYVRGSVSTNNTGLGGISSASAIIYLNGSTDYVELYVWQGSGGALGIQTGNNVTQFSGALVRGA
jgi:hypothetical protein